METIFIGIPAYNEEDIHQTIKTALGKATNPSAIRMGVVLHYPNKDFPNLNIYPNVKIIAIDNQMGLGTCLTRDLAASLYEGEDYYLQIDAHTIFKAGWDSILKANYKELKKTVEKPIISGYVPFWYKDKVTGETLTMRGDSEFEKSAIPWTQVPKSVGLKNNVIDFEEQAYTVEGLDTPFAKEANFSSSNYEEQFLTSGHFIFTSGKFLEEVPFDPLLTYHEENTTPMRAWTRGYRIFNMKTQVLWTREMYRGRDVVNSWRSHASTIRNEAGEVFADKIIDGCLRNKEILTGKILGIWGAPTQELLDQYELTSGIDYKKFYEEMYKVVEKTGNKHYAAKRLYDLDKLKNG